MFLVMWPGQFKRPVMYYDDFVVAKRKKIEHDKGKNNSDTGMRESLLLTQDDDRYDTGSTRGTLTLSTTQPYGACRDCFLPRRTPAYMQNLNSGSTAFPGAKTSTVETNPLEVSNVSLFSFVLVICGRGSLGYLWDSYHLLSST